MLNDISQIIIVLILLLGVIFILIRFVKYRKTNTQLLVDLFNNLSDEENSGKRKQNREK